MPDEIGFATKPQIALMQLREARQSGAPDGVVLADAGYGNDTAFRDALSELGLHYAVGFQSSTRVWAPGTATLPAAPTGGEPGRPRSLQRRPGHEPASVKELAVGLRIRFALTHEPRCTSEPDATGMNCHPPQRRLARIAFQCARMFNERFRTN